jgi:hypothetical protein
MDVLRWIALLSLIVLSFIPLDGIVALRPDVQWALAAVAVALFVVVDPVAAFVFTLALIIVYFRINLGAVRGMGLVSRGRGTTLASIPTVDAAVLENISSNNVGGNPDDVQGIRGVYGEDVYGAQGNVAGGPSGVNASESVPVPNL